MKRGLWLGLVVGIVLVGCVGRVAPDAEDYALNLADLPAGFDRTVEERGVQYLQLLIPEQARGGLVDGHAVGFESDGDAGSIRSLIFVYEGEIEAAAAFTTLLPAEPSQALPELGTEVYLNETAGPQEEFVVTFRKENMVGSISVRLPSDAMHDPQETAVELAWLTLRRMGE